MPERPPLSSFLKNPPKTVNKEDRPPLSSLLKTTAPVAPQPFRGEFVDYAKSVLGGGPVAEGPMSGVGNAIFQGFLGATKGALSTIATVPKRVTEIVEIIGRGKEVNKTSRAILEGVSLIDSLEQEMANLPEGDPRKQETARLLVEHSADIARLAGNLPKIIGEKTESIFGGLKPVGTAQKVGFGIEKVGEFVAAGAGTKGMLQPESGIGTTAEKVLRTFMKSGIEAGIGGTVTAAQGGEIADIKRAAVLSFIFSVPFKAWSEFHVSGALAKPLQKSAEVQMGKALAPTTKTNKELTEKIVPEMLRRRVKFASLGGLAGRAEQSADDAAEALEGAYNSLPQNTKATITPVIHAMEQAKQRLVVAGTDTIPEAALPKYKALQEIQQEILNLAKGSDDTVALESLRSYRQILDDVIKRTGKTFGLSGDETAKLAAQKVGANAIRHELAEQFPNIGKLNKEYTFWKNVQAVAEATNLRQRGQQGAIAEVMTGVGAGVGLSKGGVSTAVWYAVALRTISQIIRSPIWRSVAANQKQKIAEMLMKSDPALTDLLNRLLVGSILKR